MKSGMKIFCKTVCSFTGVPTGDDARVLALQPKPINSTNWEHHNHSSKCFVRVVHVRVEHDMEPRNLWVACFGYADNAISSRPSKKRAHCRVFWRHQHRADQWKRMDYSHDDVKMAVLETIRRLGEKLVMGVMSS